MDVASRVAAPFNVIISFCYCALSCNIVNVFYYLDFFSFYYYYFIIVIIVLLSHYAIAIVSCINASVH